MGYITFSRWGGMSILEHFVSSSLKWRPIFVFILNGVHPGGGGIDLSWGGGGGGVQACLTGILNQTNLPLYPALKLNIATIPFI